MKAILLICLQLLGLAFCATQSSEATPFPSAYDIRQIYPECSFAIYEEGVCTGNWAIAIADAISDLVCMQNTDTPNPLSPQQIIDCVDANDLSCINLVDQGTIEDALNHVISTGLQNATCYPYTSEFTGVRQSCQSACADGSAFTNGTTIQSFSSLQTPEDIMTFIMSYGSVIAIIPIGTDYLLYSSGVFVPDANAQQIGSHVIKIVGWQTDDATNQMYWIAANSWSINWGMQGYVNIYQNSTLIQQAYGVIV